MNVISMIFKAIIGAVVTVEEVIFAIIIRPLLLVLYNIVGNTQWVGIIDRLFDLLAESWPPRGVVESPPDTPDDTKPPDDGGKRTTPRERRTLLNR